MRRSIKALFNFEPPATELDTRDGPVQFVIGGPLPAHGGRCQSSRTALSNDQVRRISITS